MSLIGHKQGLQLLTKLLSPPYQRRSLGLVAPEGVGRYHCLQTAFQLANPTLTTQDLLLDTRVAPENPSVDTLRELIAWSDLAPYKAPCKLLIVPGDSLSKDSQQVLLKLLEDIPPRVVLCIVLTSLNISDTLVSRILPVYLYTVSRNEAEAIWTSQGISSSVFKQFWELAPGQPGVSMKRFSLKYPQLEKSLVKFFETPSAIGMLQWQDQIAQWPSGDIHAFWEWVLPNLYRSVGFARPENAKFISLVSEGISFHKQASLLMLVPALAFEAYGN